MAHRKDRDTGGLVGHGCPITEVHIIVADHALPVDLPGMAGGDRAY